MLLPTVAVGLNVSDEFSSCPVPSSNNVTEKVFDAPANPAAVQSSAPNCGTLIQRTLNAFTFAKPNAWTGKVPQLRSRADGFRSVHAGAIRGGPCLKSGTLGSPDTSPEPNVMLPFELRNNPFHTQFALPTGPPNTNSNPPLCAPPRGRDGVPLPSESSPRFGTF